MLFLHIQKILADAFRNGNLSNFMHALEILNADPNYILDDDTNGYTLFQNVLMTPNSAEYIRVCIENGADCYSVSKALNIGAVCEEIIDTTIIYHHHN